MTSCLGQTLTHPKIPESATYSGEQFLLFPAEPGASLCPHAAFLRPPGAALAPGMLVCSWIFPRSTQHARVDLRPPHLCIQPEDSD